MDTRLVITNCPDEETANRIALAVVEAKLADRIAILDHGKIEQVGTAQEILDNPATPFIDSFIEGIARREAQAREWSRPHVVASR